MLFFVISSSSSTRDDALSRSIAFSFEEFDLLKGTDSVNPHPFDYEILKWLVMIKVPLFSTALNTGSFVSSSEESAKEYLKNET